MLTGSQIEIERMDSLFWLQVTMDNLVTMAILDCTNDLLKESPCLIFFHASLVDNVIEELATCVFNDHDDISWSSDDLVELDDMRVSEDLEVLDFSLDSRGHVHVLNLSAVDDLHCDLVASDRVCSD